jgi:hypothetical protein
MEVTVICNMTLCCFVVSYLRFGELAAIIFDAVQEEN